MLKPDLQIITGADAGHDLRTVLNSFEASFKAGFGITEFQRQQMTGSKHTTDPGAEGVVYPRGYYRVSGIEFPNSQINRHAAARHTTFYDMGNITNGYVRSAVLFPTIISVELHLTVRDETEYLALGMVISFLLGTKHLNFTLSDNERGTRQFDVAWPDMNLSLNNPDVESPEDPAIFEYVVTFTISGNIGITKKIAKINNAGKVETEVHDANRR